MSITGQLKPAGFWRRFLATIIDGFILFLAGPVTGCTLLLIVSIQTDWAEKMSYISFIKSNVTFIEYAILHYPLVLILLFSFIVFLGYFVFLKLFKFRETLGKRIVGLR